MNRIQGARAGLRKRLLALVYRMTQRHMREIAENQTERASEPAGNLPSLLMGYGIFVSAAEKQSSVDRSLKALAVVKAAAVMHCEYLRRHRLLRCAQVEAARCKAARAPQLPCDSDEFNELEKLVLDYMVGITRTPVDVSDELFVDAVQALR